MTKNGEVLQLQQQQELQISQRPQEGPLERGTTKPYKGNFCFKRNYSTKAPRKVK